MPALSTAASIVVLLLAGCGDGGDNGTSAGPGGSDTGPSNLNSGSRPSDSSQGTTDTETIARAKFVRRANETCRATVSKVLSGAAPILREAGEGSESERIAAEAEIASTVMAPALRAEVEEIQALGTPPGDGQRVDAILSAIGGVAEIGEEDPERMVRDENVFTRAANLADSYGIGSCPYG